jgi:hypothetical protein
MIENQQQIFCDKKKYARGAYRFKKDDNID